MPLLPVLLFLWGLVLLLSSLSGRLDLLLHAVFHGLVALAGVALIALALALALLSARSRLPRLRPALTWKLTGLVAVAVLLLPPDPSFSVLASGRPQGLPEPPPLAFLLPPEQRSLSEWVRLLRTYPDPALYNGQAVRISGFVLPQPQGPALLARLQVRCCLADATPMGLPVAWPAGLQPRANQWLAIEGQMTTAPVDGEMSSVVQPRRIRAIARPRRPLEP
ncbi:MAG: TIGR03943 family protein [Synechococcus sp.]|nr:TIGR03943 family protein [Synechococcus sp.]